MQEFYVVYIAMQSDNFYPRRIIVYNIDQLSCSIAGQVRWLCYYSVENIANKCESELSREAQVIFGTFERQQRVTQPSNGSR